MSNKSNLSGVIGTSFFIGNVELDASSGQFVVRIPNREPIYFGINGVFGVEDTIGTPPDSLFNGKFYVIGSPATGIWTGKEGRVAYFNEGVWSYFSASPGWKAYSQKDGLNYTFDGTSWKTEPVDPNSVRSAIAAAEDCNVFTDSYRAKIDSMESDVLALTIALG